MPADLRPAIAVMKQYRELMWLRQQLTKQGLCSKDATSRQVIDAIRAAVPQELFTELPPVR